MHGALLETRSLWARFGGVTAVDNVDMVAEAGQICGVIGPNGAGKTSFLDAVSGFVWWDGDIFVGDESLQRHTPGASCGLGAFASVSRLFRSSCSRKMCGLLRHSGRNLREYRQ
jgi:ABC-type branched-subunit amino acid transport system ATPase component